MTAVDADDEVVVGRIGKPFGLDGSVYVFDDPDLAEAFEAGTTLGLQHRNMRLTVRTARHHGERLVVTFVESTGRETAESLRDAVLTRPRTDVTLDDESMWVAELVGRAVVDGDGQQVGSVKSVADGHAHDYLVIDRGDRPDAIVPLVADLVNHLSDPIVIESVPGLLDPDQAL